MGAAEKIEHEHEEQSIELPFLVPFPRNPRQVDAEDPKTLELAESMRARGQLTALIVRTVDEGETFQILAGNRRKVAAGIAGMSELRAVIRRDLEDDDAAFEVCLVENLQREDLSPLEESDALAQLRRSMGARVTSAELASRIGKSSGYVDDRLRLQNLTPKIREHAAKIDLGGLVTLASTSALSQGRILKALVAIAKDGRVTRANIASLLRTETKRLAGVAWKLDDAELVPEAGACSVCSKRTGAQGALIDEVVTEDDVCLDEACFSTKATVSFEHVAESARAAGAKVLSKKESDRMLEHGRPKYDSPYVDAEHTEYVGGGYKKASTLVGPDAQKVIGQDPRTGAPVEMFLRKDVDKGKRSAVAKSTAKAKKKTSSPAKVDPKRAAIQAKETAREQLEDRTKTMLLEHVVAQVKGGKVIPALLAMVLRIAKNPLEDEAKIVAQRRGLEKAGAERRAYGGSPALEKEARRLAATGVVSDLVALLHELAVAADISWNGAIGAKNLGLDWKAFEKKAAAAIASEAKTAAGPSMAEKQRELDAEDAARKAKKARR